MNTQRVARLRKKVSEMNEITDQLLHLVSDFTGTFNGAYNIREDGQCAGRQSTKNIRIESKQGLPGLEIHIAPNTKGETVYIPACVTHSNVDDLVYNDFFVGENADVTIVAGCGVHSDGEEEARHNGIHRFILAKTLIWKWTRFRFPALIILPEKLPARLDQDLKWWFVNGL